MLHRWAASRAFDHAAPACAGDRSRGWPRPLLPRQELVGGAQWFLCRMAEDNPATLTEPIELSTSLTAILGAALDAGHIDEAGRIVPVPEAP